MVLDTPRLVGFSILEFSKLHMYKAHYLHFKPKYGPRLTLEMMDTDSFIYHVVTEDIVADMEVDNSSDQSVVKFDLSTAKPAGSCPNQGTLGCFKYEPGRRVIAEFVGLQSKMYSLLFNDCTDERKAKGIPGRALNDLRHDSFKKQLFQPTPNDIAFRRIRSKSHRIEHVEQSKKGLGSFNDKVFQLDSVISIPLGHFRCKL